ncbi:MAG TPA: hypothetical protein P5556_05135 [Candidatus Gastranaerophilales bacterium]|nr:hypothetical protein [Candidatus Gastranaerophilales bacterium]
MKISFAHMGNTYIAISGALKVLGAEFIIPPFTTKKTMNLGSQHSPEVVCLPYKLVMGNYLEAIEAGAEAFLMIDSLGTCRLGEYSQSSKNAMKDMGHDIEFISLDVYKGKAFELYSGFRRATGNGNPVDLIKAINILLIKIDIIDNLDEAYSYYRARETQKGSAKKAFNEGLKLIDAAMTPKECQKALNKGLELLKKVSIDENKNVLHIDITGEIFVVLDQFSNMDIEDELGRMGAHVHRKIKLSNWSNAFLKPSLFKLRETHEDKIKKLAKEFIKRDVGGDAIESIGDAVSAGNKKSDGVIHLLPFTCMPEIVSQNIMHNISKEKNIPVLSLILDEFSGKAGFITRLEAFVDLAERRKKTRGAN